MRQPISPISVFTKTPGLATADFAYFRFHGSTSLYSSLYSPEELEGWAARIKALPPRVRLVYAYFNNDAEGFAVSNARALADLLA